MNFGASASVSDYKVPSPPKDTVSGLDMCTTAQGAILLASSWDNTMSCWQVMKNNNNFQANPVAQTSLDGPALDCCLSPDGTQAYGGCADNTVRLWQLGGAQQPAARLGTHDGPVKCVSFFQPHGLVVSGGWDGFVKFWDARQQREAFKVQIGGKVLSLDVKESLMAVATTNSTNGTPHVYFYSLAQGQPQLWGNQPLTSTLKHQPRCVSLFPHGQQGYLLGSIEGRVEIKNVSDESKTFAFKCHRVEDTSRMPKRSLVYPVNSLSWHPKGIFATAGSDGTFSFWDKDNKRKVVEFKPGNTCRVGQTSGVPVTDTKFSQDGSVFAYTCSYDWHKGREHNRGAQTEIYLHAVQPNEVQAGKK